jgi:DNA replication protein DnaC
MEHISEILRRQTQTNTSRANTVTSSGAEEAEKTPPQPVCPICKGTGVVHPLLPSGKPDFSQVVPCRCTQKDLSKESQSRLQRNSNLGALVRLTFDNLLPQGRSGNPANQEQFNRAFQTAKAFAAEPRGWLVLVGPSGCGKTHLAAAIANYCLANNRPALYITTPDLLDHLRSTFSPDSEIPYDEFFEHVRSAPLLILDDLGTQTSTPWAREKLDQLLTYRFSGELPTVIVPIIPIEQLDERLRSRLTTSQLCQVCVIENKQPELLDYSWGPEFELQKGMTFDNFDWKRVNLPLEQQENLKEAFRLAFDFARSPEGWLVFMGVTGCGKTHLAAAIVNYCYQAKQPARFEVVPDFLDHLRSTFSPESKVSYDQTFERVKTAPLLVLDDFGEQSTTPWAREKLYQVINYRYNARLATVITTRYSLQEILEEVESSISSRLIDPKISVAFNIMAPDYRGDLRPSPRAKTPYRNRKSPRAQ